MRTSINRGAVLLLLTVCLAPAAQAGGQPKTSLTEAEKRLLELTNQERTQANLPPLRANPTLCRVAKTHSANMARQSRMNHVLDGKDPFRRLQDAGYRFFWAGENIAYGFEDPAEVLRVWMNSPGHRQNILNPNYTEIGLGRALDDRGIPFYTQVFARPAPQPPGD